MSQDLNPQVPKIERVEVTPPIEGSESTQVTGKPFSSYMEAPQGPSAQQGSNVSPMELSRPPLSPNAPPTVESVNNQMQAASSSLGDLQNKLNTPDLKLKPSQKYLLRNKLTEANDQIRGVAEKVGVDVGPPVNTLSRNNPLAKFLSLITDGERQLNAAQQSIQGLVKKGNLSPGDLLLMQVKLNKAQQEIEYSTILLSKAVDDIKVIFNVQI
jgi:hypothetical protein